MAQFSETEALSVNKQRRSRDLTLRAKPVGLSEILVMAIAALWRNQLRTGLTMLGVIIGIGSVSAISSIGKGVQKATEQQIQALGTDVLQVSPGAVRSGNVMQALGSGSTLTWEDAQALNTQVPAVQGVAAYLQANGQVVYSNQNYSTSIVGTDLNFPTVQNTYPAEGRYFTQTELNGRSQVAILGATVRQQLFRQAASVLNTHIRINGEQYEVIGVMEKKGAQGPLDRDDRVYIPLTTMSARIVGNNALAGISVNGIYAKVVDQTQMSAAEFQIANVLRLRHNLAASQADDFRITNSAEIIKTLSNIVGSLTIMVVAIAGISLVVGGIGIANIMLVSVVERTREIGVRKAVGATNRAILSQFLAESVVISTLGGMVGIGTGILVAFGSATTFQFPFVVSGWAVASGVGLSFTVGLLAGVIPARNAARLDPIAALRNE